MQTHQAVSAPANVSTASSSTIAVFSPSPEPNNQTTRKSNNSHSEVAKTFQGTWSAWYKNKVGGFDLLLIQEGNELKGFHSVVTQNGNKVDNANPSEDEPTIFGKVEGNIALVDFTTIETKNKDNFGKARITLNSKKIKWQILQPMNAWNLYPDKVVLRKMSNKTTW